MKHVSSAQITTEQQLDAHLDALRLRKQRRARLERIDEYFRAGVVIFLAIGLAVAVLFWDQWTRGQARDTVAGMEAGRNIAVLFVIVQAVRYAFQSIARVRAGARQN